jgi:hypothetical protein
LRRKAACGAVVAARKSAARRKTVFIAMKTHLHLSLLPGALVAPSPTPEQSGQHHATSHRYQYKGQSPS